MAGVIRLGWRAADGKLAYCPANQLYMFKMISILLAALLSASWARSQDEPCVCCGQSVLEFKDDYTELFAPTIIKARHLRELTVYTTARQLAADAVRPGAPDLAPTYREAIFYFNPDGYVVRQVVFNRQGRFHSEYDFARNAANQITRKFFTYLDSTGHKTGRPDQQWQYTYGATGRITRIKELDDDGREQPDSKSTYRAYTYDARGRLSTEVQQHYFDEATSSVIRSSISYSSPAQSTATSLADKRPFTVEQSRYDPRGRPVETRTFDGTGRRLLEQKMYTYTATGQLLTYQVKNTGVGTECPDGGSYTNAYEYAPTQLIRRITHTYGHVRCEMRFEYR